MILKTLKNISIWIASTYLILLIITLIVFWYQGMSITDTKDFFPYLAKRLLVHPIGWILLISPYAFFKLFKYLLHTWKNHNRLTFLKRFSLTILLPIAFILSGFSFSKWYTQSEIFDYQWDHSADNLQDSIKNRYAEDGKQRGMHLFGGRRGMNDLIIQELITTNMEWITLVPFLDQEDYDSETVGSRRSDYSSWNRRDSFLIEKISRLQDRGFYIMVKPHIWIYNPSSGKWRSDISAPTPEAWQQWAENYRKIILHYAKISELYKVEMFCVGTELHKTVNEHPDFWKQIIRDVRKIYSGKVTYAANWNKELYDVSFWDELDYIGIQAYYPLTQKTEPSVRELKKGWKKHFTKIEALHQKFNKPIIFSELGYKSTPDAAIEPWAWANSLNSLYKKTSLKTQANCYEAFFQTFWDKEWFAGVHFWEWQADRNRNKKRDDGKNINFTPQQKPAENIMTKWFAKIGK